MRNKKIMDGLFARKNEIVFFDEFDCLMDVIQKREQQTDSPSGQFNQFGVGSAGFDSTKMKHAHTMKLLELANNEKDDAKKKELMKAYDEAIEEQENKIDIGYLLTRFQGLASVDGRCIIATTNCPDKIDSALKRKGRFDIILRLGNATPKMIRDILMYYFNITDEQERETLTREYPDSVLPNEVLSPAEIQDFASRSSSIRDAFAKLMVPV
jgi:SpoVK/Ycf46/Vps4 family AAA+-type ATPase